MTIERRVGDGRRWQAEAAIDDDRLAIRAQRQKSAVDRSPPPTAAAAAAAAAAVAAVEPVNNEKTLARAFKHAAARRRVSVSLAEAILAHRHHDAPLVQRSSARLARRAAHVACGAGRRRRDRRQQLDKRIAAAFKQHGKLDQG